jgi:hypothetical protein
MPHSQGAGQPSWRPSTHFSAPTVRVLLVETSRELTFRTQILPGKDVQEELPGMHTSLGAVAKADHKCAEGTQRQKGTGWLE